MAVEGLIVGLGNPGTKYAGTRHNVGFLCIDALLDWAERVSVESGNKFQCELWKGWLPGGSGPWLFAKPQTFMNLSGEAVQPLAAWHRIEPARIVVFHDELDLPSGRMKFKKGGGNAGHNGLKSITQRLGTPDFYRLRVGIGRPPAGGETVGWVLGGLTGTERSGVEALFPTLRQGVQMFADGNVTDVTRLINAYQPPSA